MGASLVLTTQFALMGCYDGPICLLQVTPNLSSMTVVGFR